MTVRVEAVCVGTSASVAKEPRDEVHVSLLGLEGDRHSGETRYSASQRKVVPNLRRWSAVSTGDVEALYRKLEVLPFPAGAMGENIHISGMSLAGVSPGAVLSFPSGCRLEVTTQIDPCETAAAELGESYGPAVARYFARESFGRRGVAGIVHVPGAIRPGDEVEVLLPRAAAAAD